MEIPEDLKPVSHIYKGEVAAIGFALASAIGYVLGWQPELTSAVAVVIGYGAAYLRYDPVDFS